MFALPPIAQADPGAALAGACVGIVVGLVLVVLIGAVILRAAASFALKLDIPFGQACLVVLAAAIIGGIINFAIGIATAPLIGASAASRLIVNLITLPISFLVSSAIYGSMIKFPETGQPIGFGKGMKVTLFQYLICIVITVVLVVVIMVVVSATGGMRLFR